MSKKKADGAKKTATLTRRQGEQMKEWKGVSAATAANAADLSGAAIQQAALVEVIAEVDKILTEKATFRASKQMATQRLKTLFNKGGKLSTVLKAIAKQHYGHGNDKLVEFGIQPLRSRPKPTVEPPTTPPPTTPPPTAETPAPAPATTQPSSKQRLSGACLQGTPSFCASTCPADALATCRCEHATVRCVYTSVRCELAMRRCELTIRRCDLALRQCDLAISRCELAIR